ncbi:MAG: helix-turn-helix domain-containing protein [Actinomycetota bacterium]
MGADDQPGADLRKWLKQWRHTNRLSQAALGEALGYDANYIAKIEGGSRPPTRQFVARLAQVAGKPADALLHATSSDVARPPLPVPPDTLVGRGAELGSLVSAMEGAARLVTLVGPPGIGKTRLASEVANRLDPALVNGAWWVSLLDVGEAGGVVGRVCRELAVSATGGSDQEDALVQRLRGQQSLLVLDNFEHVIEARSLVSRLCATAPGLRVLVTSREALGLVNEHVFPVPLLTVPDLSTHRSLAEIATSTAVELFVSRAKMADPRFDLNERNCLAVAQMCTLVDGLPLAIVLAAGRAPFHGAATLAHQAASPLRLGEGAPADLPDHHQSLASAIAASWALLDEDEARLLDRLSVFAGGFDAEGASAVGGGDGVRTLGLLASLAGKSLIEHWPDDRDLPRFDMLASIRSYAANRLAIAGDEQVVRGAHARYFAALAGRCGAGLTGVKQSDCVAELALEVANIRTAFDWAIEHDPAMALDIAASTWRFMLMRDIPTGRQWLAKALAGSTGPSRARAVALAAAGALAWVTGHYDEAEQVLAAAAAMAERLGLPDVVALALLNQGALAEQRSLLDEADRCFAAAVALYHSIGDDRGRAQALIGRGMISRHRGEVDQACLHWTDAARLLRDVGDRFNQTLALSNLAWAAEKEGQYEEAQEWLAGCRRAQIALGDARGLATTTTMLARLAYKRGATESAEVLALDALVAFQQLGDRPWSAATLVILAAAFTREKRWRTALKLVGTADGLWEEMRASPRPDQDAMRSDVLSGCGRHVTPGEASRSLNAGRAMDLTDAIDLVRREGAGGEA